MSAKQPTLKQLQTAAQMRWGHTANVTINKNAPTAEQRAEYLTLNAVANARIKAIDAELKSSAMKSITERLTKAAQFVCDVNGDHPSIDQLRIVVAEATRRDAMNEERRTLDKERNSRITWVKRYKVTRMSDIGSIFAVVEADADTAAELMEKIKDGKYPSVAVTSCVVTV